MKPFKKVQGVIYPTFNYDYANYFQYSQIIAYYFYRFLQECLHSVIFADFIGTKWKVRVLDD